RAQRDGVDVTQRVFVNVWRKSSGAPSDSVRSILWHDHKLWAGTTEGLAVIETKPFRVVTIIRPAALGGPMVVGLAAAPGGAVRLSNSERPVLRFRQIGAREDRWRGNNEVSFEFAALTFTDESRVHYRTRLFGYDRDWSPDRPDVKIRYTNLPAWLFPRRYTFGVMAHNSD